MPLPMPHLPKTENDSLRARAEALHLHGLLTHWSEGAHQPWLEPMLDWEEQQRARRSRQRRLRGADAATRPGLPPMLDGEDQQRPRRSLGRRLGGGHIGRFKPLCDFDWNW